MILTGKAREDFYKWYANTDSKIKYTLLISLFDGKSNIEKYAYYIEWFDSVGVYISIIKGKNISRIYIESEYKNYPQEDNEFETRQEATTEAIKKANKIYNESRV